MARKVEETKRNEESERRFKQTNELNDILMEQIRLVSNASHNTSDPQRLHELSETMTHLAQTYTLKNYCYRH